MIGPRGKVQRHGRRLAILRLVKCGRPARGVIGERGLRLEQQHPAQRRQPCPGRDTRNATADDEEVMGHGTMGGMGEGVGARGMDRMLGGNSLLLA